MGFQLGVDSRMVIPDPRAANRRLSDQMAGLILAGGRTAEWAGWTRLF